MTKSWAAYERAFLKQIKPIEGELPPKNQGMPQEDLERLINEITPRSENITVEPPDSPKNYNQNYNEPQC